MAQERDKGLGLSATTRTLPIALLRAREAVMDRFRPLLQAHDISEQKWRLLRILQEDGALDATTLAARACVLAPSLTRMLKALEARGFVAIARDGADKRRARISLLPPGSAFLATVAPSSAEVYAEIEARVGAGRLSHLLDELEALTRSLDKG